MVGSSTQEHINIDFQNNKTIVKTPATSETSSYKGLPPFLGTPRAETQGQKKGHFKRFTLEEQVR
jgi:hypothetical protein